MRPTAPTAPCLPRPRAIGRTNDDTTARLWDSETGKPIGVLAGHTASVRHAKFHPDGKVLATSSHDGTVRIWDTATRELLRVLGPFDVRVNVSEFNPHTPSELLIGLYSGELVLANWTNGEIIARWAGEHEGEVLGLSYHPKGEWFVSASARRHRARDSDGDPGTSESPRARRGERPSAVFSPDGQWLATGGHDWRVKLWATGTLGGGPRASGHTQGVYSVSFSDDGRRLLSTGTDGISILWDPCHPSGGAPDPGPNRRDAPRKRRHRPGSRPPRARPLSFQPSRGRRMRIPARRTCR